MIIKTCCLLILSICTVVQAHSQEFAISGRITSSEDNQPIIGVNVVIKGSTQGTVTDLDGTFNIFVPDRNATIIVSYMGYQTQEIQVDGRVVINVILERETIGLDEVVVIGYGTAKKADLTGAISIADVDEMKKTSQSTLSEALQGRVTGVTVKTSGQPGQTPNIYIRGISSMFTNTSPLFVIDGLPTSETRDFNPEDIESVQVLKDASAAAIYGSRASNGVIIVTTKKGAAGKTRFDFSAKYGVQNITKKLSLMDGPEWLALHRMRYTNANLPIPEIHDTTINTDWQDAIYQTGIVQDYNLTASGGGENSAYLISGSYYSNKGSTIGPTFDRLSLRVNGNLGGKRWKIDESILLSTSFSNDPVGTPFTDVIRMVPLLPVKDTAGNYTLGNGTYNGDGTRTNGSNPVAHNDIESITNRSFRLQGSVSFEYSILEFLKYKITLGVEANVNRWQQKIQNGRWYGNQIDQSSYTENRNLYHHSVIENLLTFEKTFGEHYINAIAGYTEERWEYSDMISKGFDITQDNSGNYFWTLPNAQDHSAPIQYIQQDALRSFLGRIMYNYGSKYYATASIRRDGSSKFHKDNRYGNFPSASIGWRISNESFFSNNVTFISDFKLRASYGSLGNQGIGNYRYTTVNNNFQPYIFDGSRDNIQWGSIQISLIDPNIQWESKVTSNIGFDLGFLSNSLIVNADYYINRSTNLINNVPIPYHTGHDPGTIAGGVSITRNIGEVENKGFELSIDYRKTVGEFSFQATGNFTTVENKVIKLGGGDEPIYGPKTKTMVGRSLGEFFLLLTDGIYQEEDTEEMSNISIFGAIPQPGDERYKDINKRNELGEIVSGADSLINADDRTFAGSPWPKLEYSLNFTCSYKNFDLSMYLYGLYGRTLFNNMEYWLQNTGDNGNYQAGLDPWTPENRTNTTPIASFGKLLRGDTDRFLEDGSFLRIQNIQLGYSVPQHLTGRIGIERVRCYLSVDNLHTFTKYSGLDPDVKGAGVFGLGFDNNSYPNIRTFSAGIQMGF